MHRMERDTDQLKSPAIVWFRSDLRIADNEALSAASDHASLIPVYIRETESGARPLGAARQWWLHHSLERLAADLEGLGTPLILLSGKPADLIRGLVSETGASAVYWNRRYDPALTDKDAALKAELQSDDLLAESFPGQLLHEPTRLRTTSGTFYKVYSPFWRAIEGDIEDRPPLDCPRKSEGLRRHLEARIGKTRRLEAAADQARLVPRDKGGMDTRRSRRTVNGWQNSWKTGSRATPSVGTCQGWTPHPVFRRTLRTARSPRRRSFEAMKDADANASIRRSHHVPQGSRLARVLLASASQRAGTGDTESQFQIRRIPLAQ
jgi:hypothetical protein